MVVASLNILSFIMELDSVFVEGDTMRNKCFVGIVYFYEINRITKA